MISSPLATVNMESGYRGPYKPYKLKRMARTISPAKHFTSDELNNSTKAVLTRWSLADGIRYSSYHNGGICWTLPPASELAIPVPVNRKFETLDEEETLATRCVTLSAMPEVIWHKLGGPQPAVSRAG